MEIFLIYFLRTSTSVVAHHLHHFLFRLLACLQGAMNRYTEKSSNMVSKHSWWPNNIFYADFEQPRSMLPIEILPEKSGQEAPSCPDIPRGPRKVRRKKTRTSSPTSSARSSSSRSRTSFATAYDAFNESQRGFRVAWNLQIVFETTMNCTLYVGIGRELIVNCLILSFSFFSFTVKT